MADGNGMMPAQEELSSWLPGVLGTNADKVLGSMPAMAQLGLLPDFKRLTILPDGNGAVPFCFHYNIPAASVTVTKDTTFAWDLFANILAPTVLSQQFGYSGDTSTITFLFNKVSVCITETTNISTGTYTGGDAEKLLTSYWLAFGQGSRNRYISFAQCARVGHFDVAAIATTNATEIATQHRLNGIFSDGGVWNADTGVPLRLTNDRANAQLVCGNTHGITILANSFFRVSLMGYAWNASINLEGQTGSGDPCDRGGALRIPGEVKKLLGRFNVRRLSDRFFR
jgi:hypothetical protein